MYSRLAANRSGLTCCDSLLPELQLRINPTVGNTHGTHAD